jgi:hypothetical protein
MMKKNELRNINYLELTPYRLYDSETGTNGMEAVLIPRFTNKVLVRLISPLLKSQYVKVKLDAFGSEAWKHINGRTKVNDIAAKMLEKFGAEIHPVEERLTKFLTQLNSYKIIAFNEIKK